jgi:MscS family membrane protein
MRRTFFFLCLSRLVIHVLTACVFACAVSAIAVQAQKSDTPAAASQTDPLGRHTPRGTVREFLDAARSGNLERAAQYLNVRAAEGEALARQLFVVLDARLPARLMRISDEPDGSGASAPAPNQQVVGTIESQSTRHEIVLERVTRGEPPPIWLFSRETLAAIPALHDEIVSSTTALRLPRFLTDTRIGDLHLIDVLALMLGLPVLYLVTLVLNRVFTPLLRRALKEPAAMRRNVLPVPARLLLVTIAGGVLMSALPLSLVLRQLWSSSASLLTIVTVAWLLILANAEVERHLHRRIGPSHVAAAASLLRVLRRFVDVAIVFGALIVMLRQFGVDPTPALAGLGVGGIAVALAAQKTLENVIAGVSLIFDKALKVGDFLKMGDVIGTVDHIGLRSTRIRTLDRTVVSVPNGQIANASLETMSARDKFWFHPIVGLRYETTPEQLHHVLDDLNRLLREHPLVDVESVRVRFFRLGSSSLDIEVFAYLLASDWDHFLELQERLLFDVTEIVVRAGTAIAFPSQTTYVAGQMPMAAPWSLPTP